jgi:hypothetical protein
MRLLALDPQFIAYVQRHDEGVRRNFKVPVRTLPEADGISFRCPVCAVDGKELSRFAHFVVCWFEGRVPDDAEPGPGRWNPRGHGYKDLSFVPGVKSKSVQLLGGCNAHFHLTDGEVHP